MGLIVNLVNLFEIYMFFILGKHRDTPENNADLPFDFTKENYAVSFI